MNRDYEPWKDKVIGFQELWNVHFAWEYESLEHFKSYINNYLFPTLKIGLHIT